MPNLYVIAGCNGAGKTTASFTVLPDMLECQEFINADEIARGLSPFNPEKAAIEAGRIMLGKIDQYIEEGIDFSIETTLATKSYIRIIKKAQNCGYRIVLVFFRLESVELAIERVSSRVADGGHSIPTNVIIRRYYSGIQNLFKLYIPICDYWMIFDNSEPSLELIAEGKSYISIKIINNRIFEALKNTQYDI